MTTDAEQLKDIGVEGTLTKYTWAPAAAGRGWVVLAPPLTIFATTDSKDRAVAIADAMNGCVALAGLSELARQAHELPPDERETMEWSIITALRSRAVSRCACRTDVKSGQYSTDCPVHGLRTALPPHTADFGAPGHPKHWCERCRIEAETETGTASIQRVPPSE